MRPPTDFDLDLSICYLASAATACFDKEASRVRHHLKCVAVLLKVDLDVYAEGTGGLRVVQELALTAAKALCEVRAPAVHGNPSHPDTRERAADVAESLEQARANIVSAWEVLCGRRPV